MDTSYHPDFGSEVKYEFSILPESADGQIRSTIARVIDLIRKDAQTPFLQAEAQRMLELGQGDPNQGLWKLSRSMRFKKDEKIADDLPVDDPRKTDTIEVLIRPVDQWLLIKLRGMGVGDCDCFHMYGACLLLAAGVPCSLVTISADSSEPGRFSHVYLASYWGGKRTALDLSHGEYPGWEAPNLGRIREWPVQWTWSEHISVSALAIGSLAVLYFGLEYLDRRYAA